MPTHRFVTSRPLLLVLRALGLGDTLASIPALRALARAFPNHYRVLAAPVNLAPLVKLSGAIDEVIDAAPLQPLKEPLDTLDVAVNLHGRGPQSHRILLALRPKRLIAFQNDDVPESAGSPQWEPDEHEIERWCRLLAESGVPADASDLEVTAPWRDERSVGAIVVHPGAASESRRWQPERWIELCRRLRSLGHRVVLTGNSDEFRRCRFIAKSVHLPIDTVLAGKTGLDDLTSLVACARAVVCGDTGIAHIATAVGTPSVVLFGPTSPKQWGPPANRRRHRVIWRGTTSDPHAASIDPGLASITVDEVMSELAPLILDLRKGA